MELSPLGTLVLSVAGLQIFVLLMLHIAGDMRMIGRRLQIKRERASDLRDKYKLTLSAIIYHHDTQADLASCIASLVKSGHKLQRITILNIAEDRGATQIAKKFRSRTSATISTRSYTGTEASRKRQTSNILAGDDAMLILAIDSTAQLVGNQLLQSLKYLKDPRIGAAVPHVVIRPSNRLTAAVAAVHTSLVQHFRRMFSGRATITRNVRKPAAIIRMKTMQRLSADSGAPESIAELLSSTDVFNRNHRIAAVHDWFVSTTDARRYSSPLAVSCIILVSQTAALVYLVSRLGLYNTLPFIGGLWVLLVMFGVMAQSGQRQQARGDTLALGLLAPISLLNMPLRPIASTISAANQARDR
jgi:hypothetical protein